MWSVSLVMSECALSGRGQGHVSNFYIVDLKISPQQVVGRQVIYTTQRRRFVYDTWDNGSRLDRVMVEFTLSITHCLRLNLQIHTIDLVRTCRISSFCTVALELANFNWHDASRGPSAIAELLVMNRKLSCMQLTCRPVCQPAAVGKVNICNTVTQ